METAAAVDSYHAAAAIATEPRKHQLLKAPSSKTGAILYCSRDSSRHVRAESDSCGTTKSVGPEEHVRIIVGWETSSKSSVGEGSHFKVEGTCASIVEVSHRQSCRQQPQ